MNSPIEMAYVQEALPVVGTRRIISLMDLSVPTDTLELYCALMTCLWGGWISVWHVLATHWYPWADLSDVTNILNLAFTFMPQWVWGMLGFVIGGSHLITRLQQIRWRRTWLLLSLMFWVSVTLTIVVRVPYSTCVIAYGGLAFASGLSYLRLYIIDNRLLAAIRQLPQEPPHAG